MIEFTFWDILRNLLLAARWTVLLSLAAFVGGALVGLVVLFFRIAKNKWSRRIASGYIALFQGTPLLMQLFLMFFGLPMLGLRIEPWTAAVLGLTFFASAYLAEIWRSGVAALPQGQWDAGASLGLHYLQELRLIILPQALKVIYPALTSQVVIMMLESAVVSQIAVRELTYEADMLQARTFRAFETYFVVPMVYLALSMGLRRLLVSGGRRVLGAGVS